MAGSMGGGPVRDMVVPVRASSGGRFTRFDIPVAAEVVGSGAKPVAVRLSGEDEAVRALLAVIDGAMDCAPAVVNPDEPYDVRAYTVVLIPPTMFVPADAEDGAAGAPV